MTPTKVLWISGFTFIVGAGIVGILLLPGNYAMPACLNMLAGYLMGLATMLEKSSQP